MFSSIVVGTDGSETAGEAVRQATELASAVGAEIHLVSAFQPVGNQRLREERRDRSGEGAVLLRRKLDKRDAEIARAAGGCRAQNLRWPATQIFQLLAHELAAILLLEREPDFDFPSAPA